MRKVIQVKKEEFISKNAGLGLITYKVARKNNLTIEYIELALDKRVRVVIGNGKCAYKAFDLQNRSLPDGVKAINEALQEIFNDITTEEV